MKEGTPFSATRWITANIVSSERLLPETLEAVQSFTLMWSVFEGLVCDNSATISRLEKLSAEIVQRRRCQADLERFFTYFQKHYHTGTAFTDHFESLRLRSSDRRDFIQAVLRDERTDFESRVLALLFIVNRIQANLFHGPRSLDMLNSLEPVLNAASRALATILEAHGRHVRRERYAE